MKNKLILLVILLFSSFILSAQPDTDQSLNLLPPSPEAMSITKFIDHPISYNTGIPEISIPITTVKGRGISVPVSLSYHGGGIRVDEIASSVGLGWSLQAGGIVTRTVVGKADEFPDGFLNRKDDIPTSQPYDIETMENFAHGVWDGKPDVFSFSAGNYSGKFVLESNSTVRVIPHQDIKIELTKCTNCSFPTSQSYYKIEIITPDGLKYIYGTDGALEFSSTTSYSANNNGGCSVPNYDIETVTGWYLKKIVNPITGDEVQFNYEDRTLQYDLSYNEMFVLRQQSYTDTECSPINVNKTCITDKTDNTVFLKSIVSSEGSVVFQGGSRTDVLGASKIDNIEIKGKLGVLEKKIDLVHQTVYSGGSTPSTKPETKYRMYLDEVKEINSIGDVIKTTSFDYKNRTSFPPRLSFSKDHWGYFNGKTNSQLTSNYYNWGSYLDVIQSNFNNFNLADRSPDDNFSDVATLNKIVYPTGGHVKYEYEGNTIGICDTVQNIVPNTSSAISVFQGQGVETDIEYFTITETQSVTIRYDVLQIGFRRNGAEVKLFNSSNTLLFHKGGDAELYSPVHLQGEQELQLTPGTYRLEAKAKVGPDPYFPPPFNTSPEHARIYVDYTEKVAIYVENESVGGIRIKKLEYDDGDVNNANNIIRTFSYNLLNQEGCNRSTGVYLGNKPKYLHWRDTPNTYGCECKYAYISTSNLVTMVNQSGKVVEYSTITENHGSNGENGKIELQFDVFPDTNSDLGPNGLTGLYAYSPMVDKSYLNGRLLKKTIFNADNDKVSENIYDYEINESLNYNKVRGMYVYKLYDLECLDQYKNFAVEYYDAISQWIYLKQEKERQYSLDGSGNYIETITNYDYESNGKHTIPTSTSILNSDGKLTLTTNKYPPEYTSGVEQKLTDWNIINVPIETLSKVNGGIVSGRKNIYSYVDNNGNPTQTINSIRPPLLHYYQNREITWNSSGIKQDNGWVTQLTIDSYNDDCWFPSRITKAGWDSEYFTWTDGLLTNKSFGDFNWNFSYYANSRLLKNQTDIDGQIINYEYDNFLRLKKIIAKGGKEIVNYTYHYKQNPNEFNYRKTKTEYGSSSYSEFLVDEKIEYLDGLGRVIQVVDKNQTSDDKDVVISSEYDSMGRTYKVFDKVKSTFSDGRYFTIPQNTLFTLTQYKPSPLNIIDKITPPNWYATDYDVELNEANEVLKINQSGYYSANSLLKTIITDPNGNKILEYKDKLGRKVLEKRTNAYGPNSSDLDTYFVYDDKNRIKTILPPGSNLSTSELIYSYLYDGKDLLVRKKVPDSEFILYKYNNRDLPILVQDGNMRANSKWLLSKYDVYGRVTQTGFYTGSNPQPSNNLNFSELLTENCYDGVNCNGSVYSTNPINKGKLRQKRSKLLDNSGTFIKTTIEYDSYGRIYRTRENNHTNSFSNAEYNTYQYSYSDQLTRHYRSHKPISGITRTMLSKSFIDNDGRDKAQKLLVYNSGINETTLYQNAYNHRDELTQKYLGQFGSTFLQELNYSYNAQGWLERINSESLGGGSIPLPNNSTTFPSPSAGSSPRYNDLFYLELKYDQLFPSVQGTSQKNGNIAQQIFRVRGRERILYNYTYDSFDRLKRTKFYEVNDAGQSTYTNKYYSSNYYDKRGNIKNIYRRGPVLSGTNYSSGNIDNLTYAYYPNSNRIRRVTENLSQQPHRNEGFKPGLIADYLYDANGNLTFDPSKEMTIVYNHLNLPKEMTFTGGKKVEFLYDADGVKRRKKVIDPVNGNSTIDYYNGIENHNGTLHSIYHSEGRLYNMNVVSSRSQSLNLRHEYVIRDHLGNTRLTFTDKNADGVIGISSNQSVNEILSENNYYSFGMQMNGPWMNGTGSEDKTKYTYNGKELQDDFEINLHDYDFRFYDPTIGRFTTVDPLTEDYTFQSPYTYAENNPILYIDYMGLGATNEYVRDKETGETRMVGTKGGNETDYVYEGKITKDSEGNQTGAIWTESEDNTTILNVETSFTPGAGNDFGNEQQKNPTPGFRETHGKTPAVFLAVGTIWGGLTLGKTVVKKLFGTVPRGPGAKGSKRVKTKSERKINPKRLDSWKRKEQQAREGLKNATTKAEKKAFRKQIDHAVNQQKKSEVHWN